MAGYQYIAPPARHFVQKSWGWESWYLNDKAANLCQKMLCITCHQNTSIHRHRVKDEIIACDTGLLCVEVEDPDFADGIMYMLLEPGASIRIEPGTWHRICAITASLAYEASTYHDDEDVERADTWGAALNR